MDSHYKKPGKEERYNVKLGSGGIREIEFTVQAFTTRVWWTRSLAALATNSDRIAAPGRQGFDY